MTGHRWYIDRTGLWGTSLPMGHPEQAGTIRTCRCEWRRVGLGEYRRRVAEESSRGERYKRRVGEASSRGEQWRRAVEESSGGEQWRRAVQESSTGER